MSTIYISPTGNDTTGAGTYASPYLTTTKAIAVSAVADTIFFKNGTYTWNSTNYNMNAPRTFQGESTSGVIMDGGNLNLLITIGTNDTTAYVKNFTFKNVLHTQSSIALFTLPANGSITKTYFENCIFDKTIYCKGYYFYAGGLMSVANGHVDLTVTGCLFNDVKINNIAGDPPVLFGIQANGIQKTRTMRFYNNVYYAFSTGASGAMQFFGTGSSYTPTNTNQTLIMKNNIFYNGSGATMWFHGGLYGTVEITSTNNNYYLLDGIPTLGTGDITTDPLFVDPTLSNFELQLGSPCISGGTII